MALPERQEQRRQRNTLELRGFVADTAAPTRYHGIHVRAREYDHGPILSVERRPPWRRHRMGEARQRHLHQSGGRRLQRQRRGDRALEGLAREGLHLEDRSAEREVAQRLSLNCSERRASVGWSRDTRRAGTTTMGSKSS